MLATPLVEAARRNRPNDTIIAVVRTGCGNLIETNPHVDTVLEWDKHGGDGGMLGLFRFAGRLREYGVDTALIPQRYFRTGFAAMLSGAKTRAGFDRDGGRFFHTVRVPYRQGIHEVERNLLLAEALNWDTTGCTPLLVPDDGDRESVEGHVGSIGDFCVFAPGSVWATKRWPHEYFSEIGGMCEQRGLRIVLSGGPGDVELCGAIADKLPRAVNLSGVLSLRQSAELYNRARFVLTGDSAPQHIAAAMGVWVFALFGPTVQRFGFTPYTERGVVIEESLNCRPCNIHGPKTCPLGTHACMRNITPTQVMNQITETLNL